jgi:hypothetical protein
MARVTEERVKELIGEAVGALSAEVQKEFAIVYEKLDSVQASNVESSRRLESMIESLASAVGGIQNAIYAFGEPRQPSAESAAILPTLVSAPALEKKSQDHTDANPESSGFAVPVSRPFQTVSLSVQAPSTPKDAPAGDLKAAVEELRSGLRTDLYTMFATKKNARRRAIGGRGSATKDAFKRRLSDDSESDESRGYGRLNDSSEDAKIDSEVESDVSENDDDIERAINRRDSFIQRVKEFDKQPQDHRAVVITRAQPSADHIKLTYLSVRAALGFARDIDCYLSKERVALSAPAYVDPKIIALVMSKNSKIRTTSNFYKLSNPELLAAIQRTIRPSTVQEFIHALEENVEFEMPGNVPPSWSRFKTFSNQLYVFRDQFLETYMYLIKGCDFERNLKFDVKTDGSIVKIFLDAIPGKYARVLMRGGRKEFDSLKDFFSFFFKAVSKHKKLARDAFNLASTYFTDVDKLKRGDQKKPRAGNGPPASRPPFKKLNQIGSLMDDDILPEFEELMDSAISSAVPRGVDDSGAEETDYFEEAEGSVSSSPTGFDSGPGPAVNAVMQSKPPLLLQRPHLSGSAARPAAMGANPKPGGIATANACFQFATTGICTRKECTYSHDPKVVMSFLEETMQKSAARLKELQGRK